jgi:hypothetical protein
MRGAVLGVVLAGCVAAGCFAPSPPTGLPCSEDRECPSGQRCDLATLVCGTEASTTDGAPLADGTPVADAPPGAPDARVDAAMVGPFGAPVALAAINSAATDADGSLTGDGLELFFASGRTGSIGALDIYVATRATASDPFVTVTRVAELSSTANDDCPDISPDGLTMYLVSARAGGTLHDVYRATRPSRAAAWTTPVLDADLSTAADEPGVVISADRRVGIVDRVTPGMGRELYQRVRTGEGAAWGPLVHLASVGSAAVDGAPAIDGAGLVLYFHSDRVIAGDFDIYRATRASVTDPFAIPVAVTELASAADDSNPWVAADDQLVLFDSARPGGLGSLDLYLATR